MACTAPHGSTSTHGAVDVQKKRITYRNAIFAARPLALGNTVHFRSASHFRSFHWCSRGLRISTQGRPPRLMCGATGVSLSPLQIMAKQLPLLFSRMDRSVQSRPSCWVLILRHGASLITLPALGTCLRAGYSVVKVRHVAY